MLCVLCDLRGEQFMNETEIQEWKDFAHHLRRLARWDLERIDHALKEALRVLPDLEEPSRSNPLKMGRVVAKGRAN